MVGALERVFGQGDAESAAKADDGVQVLGALVGVGGARDKEVVEVAVNMLDTPLACEPLY